MTAVSPEPEEGADAVTDLPATGTGDPAGDDVVAPRFPVLDTLRLVGAVCVVTTHVAFRAGDYTRHGTVGTLLARLDVGVALFFVLSGFLLARPYLVRAALGRPRPATSTYLWKRVLRIFPVYLLSAVLALTLLEGNDGRGPGDWVVTLLLLDTFVDDTLPDGLTQMWSLGVEATFYLLLPLLMLLATGRHRLRAPRVVALLLALVAVTVWWHLDGALRAGEATGGAVLQWLPAYLSWFAVGIGLALVHVLHSLGDPPRLVTAVVGLGRQPGVCWAIAGSLLLVSATPLGGPTLLDPITTSASVSKNLLYAAIGGLLVLSGIVAEPAGRYARVFASRVGRHLGYTSYSVFCLHLLALELIAHATGWPLFQGYGVRLWLLTMAATLLAAELTYRYVELPPLRLARSRPAPGSDAATTAATTGTSDR